MVAENPYQSGAFDKRDERRATSGEDISTGVDGRFVEDWPLSEVWTGSVTRVGGMSIDGAMPSDGSSRSSTSL